jgi:hypothetical protein
LLLNLLASWVEQQALIHYLGPQLLPACWLEHPRIVTLFFAAWCSYLGSVSGRKLEPRHPVVALQDWQWVIQQLRTDIENETGRCTRGHVPALVESRRTERIAAVETFTNQRLAPWLWPPPPADSQG